MGLTRQSTGIGAFYEDLRNLRTQGAYLAALAGNPNTGKSTVFNALTGLKQHTGNWPGKTVARATGSYQHRGGTIVLVDLPGTYSLHATSAEEIIARDFICFANPDATVVVADATCLERNLNLILQILEMTPRVVVCANLADEARRKRIGVDYAALAGILGVPVIPTSARSGEGLADLKDAIDALVTRAITPVPLRWQYPAEIERALAILQPELNGVLPPWIDARWAALRLLDGDSSFLASMAEFCANGEWEAGEKIAVKRVW